MTLARVVIIRFEGFAIDCLKKQSNVVILRRPPSQKWNCETYISTFYIWKSAEIYLSWEYNIKSNYKMTINILLTICVKQMVIEKSEFVRL